MTEYWNKRRMEEWNDGRMEGSGNSLIVVHHLFDPISHYSIIPSCQYFWPDIPFFRSSSFLLGGNGKS